MPLSESTGWLQNRQYSVQNIWDNNGKYDQVLNDLCSFSSFLFHLFSLTRLIKDFFPSKMVDVPTWQFYIVIGKCQTLFAVIK